MHEIEAKIRVGDFGAIKERLEAGGAEFLQAVEETDLYLDSEERLKKQGCGLRIRRQVADGDEKAFVTFKGAKAKSKYKSRPEYEIEVSNAKTTETIFAGLGYQPLITVRKKRAMWAIDDCVVCLDEVDGLGRFVEVEGPQEACIEAVLEKLGLADEPHIRSGYAAMLSKIDEDKT